MKVLPGPYSLETKLACMQEMFEDSVWGIYDQAFEELPKHIRDKAVTSCDKDPEKL